MKVETGLEPAWTSCPPAWGALCMGTEARQALFEALEPSPFPSTHIQAALSARYGQETFNESLGMEQPWTGTAHWPGGLAGNQETYE